MKLVLRPMLKVETLFGNKSNNIVNNKIIIIYFFKLLKSNKFFRSYHYLLFLSAGQLFTAVDLC